MNEKPLPTISQSDAASFIRLADWLNRIPELLPLVQTFAVVFDPASVPANSESVQTIAVAGVTTQDILVVNKPTNTAGLDLVHAWVEAADTVSVKFRNHTGSPINPGTETYRVLAVRR
jgi:hypothetical protein